MRGALMAVAVVRSMLCLIDRGRETGDRGKTTQHLASQLINVIQLTNAQKRRKLTLIQSTGGERQKPLEGPH